jgi:hypothetical protein
MFGGPELPDHDAAISDRARGVDCRPLPAVLLVAQL